MSDLRERAPARAAMEKLVSYRGTPELRELPFGLVHIQPEALMWLRGVRGELFMAEKLRRLGDRWVVLHSVPVGTRGSDIDHIVIGPPGVFPINTKRLIERFVVVDGDMVRKDGWKEHYLRNAALEAKRVDAILRSAGIVAPVLPIVAISGATSVKVKRKPHWEGRQVGVAKVEHVVRKLQARPTRLTPEQVTRIADLLSDSRQWAAGASAGAGTLDQSELFAVYRRIDRGVGRRNALIRGAAFGLLAASAIGLAAYIVAVAVPAFTSLLP